MITTRSANAAPNNPQRALAESEGRWPRICALAWSANRQSEVRYVF